MNALQPLADGETLIETSFAVPTLRCAGCISKLEDGLPLSPGIAAARVNFTAKRVAIVHDIALDPPHLQEAIEKLGFEAQPVGIAVAGDDSESRALLRALAVAGFAAMNVMLLSVSIWSGAEGTTRDLFHWVSALIALPAIAYSGRVFFKSAWSALRYGRTNMDVPISIGVLLTTDMSLYETATGGAQAYFDGAVMLLFFLLAGRWLDSVMRDRARDGVAALLKQAATGALVLRKDGGTEWRAAQDIAPNMRMIVAAGERLAADGIIEQGNTTFDLSLLTGESAPQTIGPSDTVNAGTLNIGAPITVRVTKTGPDTALADIARMMENAAQSRARYVRIADRASRLYAPAVHTAAALSFIGWMLLGADWHASLLIAAAVLIITCPCALGLAVPAAQIVAVGSLMRAGVLVKDGSALERLAEVDRALFDKTGTLTLGRPVPSALGRLSEEEKSVLLGLTRVSRHPLSQSLRRSLEHEGVVADVVEDIIEVPGFGLTGRSRHGIATIGPADTARETNLACRFDIESLPAVTICFRDELRPETKRTISRTPGVGHKILDPVGRPYRRRFENGRPTRDPRTS